MYLKLLLPRSPSPAAKYRQGSIQLNYWWAPNMLFAPVNPHSKLYVRYVVHMETTINSPMIRMPFFVASTSLQWNFQLPPKPIKWVQLLSFFLGYSSNLAFRTWRNWTCSATAKRAYGTSKLVVTSFVVYETTFTVVWSECMHFRSLTDDVSFVPQETGNERKLPENWCLFSFNDICRIGGRW